MLEETTDNEFYVVVWEDDENHLQHIFVYLRYNETIFQYMLRVHHVEVHKINQVYKRIYVKK